MSTWIWCLWCWASFHVLLPLPISDLSDIDFLEDSTTESLLFSGDEYNQDLDSITMEDFQDEDDEGADEIVRCICEMDEENGFMIQVGLLLENATWWTLKLVFMLSVNTQFHARNFSSVLKWTPFWCPCSESAICKITNNSFLILSLCLYSVRSVCAGSTVCVWGFWKTASLITTYVTSAETLQVTILCDNTVNRIL